MGILDWFRRPRDKAPDQLTDVYARLGGHGADLQTLGGRIEALRDEWIVMRDELRRLAQRLEKRDQRAEQKAAAELEEEEAGEQLDALPARPNGFNELEAQRALRERKRHRGH